MHLNARAIELVFQRRIAEHRDRVFDRLRGIREHRLHRREHLHLKRRETGLAVDERRACHARQIPGQHRGTSNARGGKPCAAGDRFDEHTFERALSQLAEQQLDQKLLLIARRGREERAEPILSRPCRACARDRAQLLEDAVDTFDRQRWRLRGRDVVRRADRRAADPDAALA